MKPLLGWLPNAHGLDERLQRRQLASFNEFDRGLVLKVSIGRIQEDARIGLVSGVEVHEGHPDPVNAPEVCLQARRIWMLAHAWSFAADRLGDRSDRQIQFPGDTCRVQPARLCIEEGSTYSSARLPITPCNSLIVRLFPHHLQESGSNKGRISPALALILFAHALFLIIITTTFALAGLASSAVGLPP